MELFEWHGVWKMENGKWKMETGDRKKRGRGDEGTRGRNKANVHMIIP
ncbi:MAG TPA: hypothetical protein VFG54_02590 [Prolixibacteraceae bacterium]|nr:hypothetical protein [Prolixibacteraceae bacterium]